VTVNEVMNEIPVVMSGCENINVNVYETASTTIVVNDDNVGDSHTISFQVDGISTFPGFISQVGFQLIFNPTSNIYSTYPFRNYAIGASITDNNSVAASNG